MSLIILLCFIQWNPEQSFDSTIYIIMLTETRDVLSLALYLADTILCIIYVMVEDEIDLIIVALEDRVPLRPLAS